MTTRSLPLRAFGRAALFTLAFSCSAGAVWLLSKRAVELAQIGAVSTSFVLRYNAVEFRKRFAALRGDQRVALVGDSTLMGCEGMHAPQRQTVPGRVATALHKYGAEGERIALQTLHVPGLGPAGMYFVSQEIVAAHPDTVVIALNLRSFCAEVFNLFAYSESSGWLTPSQLLEAFTLPLFRAGVTTDRLLFYNALVALGASEPWSAIRQRQGRTFKLREWLARRADAVFGHKASAEMESSINWARWVRLTVEVDELPRMSKLAAEHSLGPMLQGLSPRQPNLQMLSALVGRLARAHIKTLVYAEPLNVEHLRTLGLPMVELERSLVTIARTVEHQGAEFLDLHAALPERAFRDQGDHYTFQGEPNGAFRLASLLAAALVKQRSVEPTVTASHVVQ